MRPQGFSEEAIPLHSFDVNDQRPEHEDAFYVSSDLQFDRATGTKKICIAGLVFSIIVGSGFICTGALFKGFNGSQETDDIYTVSPVALELIPLGVNFVMLLITETLGFIHSTTLRWALFRERKLEFNANLRLFTYSKQSLANGYIANLLYFITLAICYSGASLILVRNTYQYYLDDLSSEQDWNSIKDNVSLSKVVPTTLGTAILIQCFLSIWCLTTAKIPTWSSNPFTTLKAAAHTGLIRQKGRCMMSVHEREKPAMPTQPRIRQSSPYGISKKVLFVLAISCLVLGVLIVWTAIIVPLGFKNQYGKSWNFIPESTTIQSVSFQSNMTMTVFLSFFATPGPPFNGPVYVQEGSLAGIMFFCIAIQSFLTIGLHCAELQIVLQRDEALWRQIESDKGLPSDTKYNSIIQPLRSIPNVVLLLFKPVIHWLFGSALQVDYATGLLMRVPQVVYLTIAWAFFVAFVASVTFHKPKGLLPASYGHLQTMLDVADDLSAEPMFWKDKGEDSSMENGPGHEWTNTIEVFEYVQIRHAGTSSKRLEEERVRPDAYYS